MGSFVHDTMSMKDVLVKPHFKALHVLLCGLMMEAHVKIPFNCMAMLITMAVIMLTVITMVVIMISLLMLLKQLLAVIMIVITTVVMCGGSTLMLLLALSSFPFRAFIQVLYMEGDTSLVWPLLACIEFNCPLADVLTMGVAWFESIINSSDKAAGPIQHQLYFLIHAVRVSIIAEVVIALLCEVVPFYFGNRHIIDAMPASKFQGTPVDPLHCHLNCCGFIHGFFLKAHVHSSAQASQLSIDFISIIHANISVVGVPLIALPQPADLEGSTLYKLGLNSIVPRSVPSLVAAACRKPKGLLLNPF
mmetsp:Transcript_18974/g.53151  ORF Transcript_18974/g.53151 Transcript_18974/m.53151 type:complete len:305 (-) Transcript_18974:1342-2256(-)